MRGSRCKIVNKSHLVNWGILKGKCFFASYFQLVKLSSITCAVFPGLASGLRKDYLGKKQITRLQIIQ